MHSCYCLIRVTLLNIWYNKFFMPTASPSLHWKNVTPLCMLSPPPKLLAVPQNAALPSSDPGYDLPSMSLISTSSPINVARDTISSIIGSTGTCWDPWHRVRHHIQAKVSSIPKLMLFWWPNVMSIRSSLGRKRCESGRSKPPWEWVGFISYIIITLEDRF